MTRTARIFLTFALVLAAAPLAAQRSAPPLLGHPARTSATPPAARPALRTTHLADRSDTLLILVDRAEAIPVGTRVLRTALTSDAGRETLMRVETVRDTAGKDVRVDSVVVLRASLSPLAQAVRDSRGTRSLRFEGGRARGESVARGVRSAVDAAVPADAFPGGSLDLVLGALPLREGFSARVAVFDAARSSMAASTVQVVDYETTRVGDGSTCRAWRVLVSGGPDAGSYWIEDRSRVLVRFEGAGSPLRMVRRSGCAPATAPAAADR
jgi:hypothetical protein